jgi:putative DNA methylase
VPLARQTWLAKKKGRFAALKMTTAAPPQVRFEVVAATTEEGLGFDPAGFSQRGNALCPFCGSTVGTASVKAEGQAGRIGVQPMAVVCTRPGKTGKVYLSADDLDPALLPDDTAIRVRIETLCAETGLTVPDEPTPVQVTGGGGSCHRYGMTRFVDIFTPRQLLALLTFCKWVRKAYEEMREQRYDEGLAKAVTTHLGMMVDRVADYNSGLCSWHNTRELIGHTYARQALPMVWDFVELNPLGNGSGNAYAALDWITDTIRKNSTIGLPAQVSRGSATRLSLPDNSLEATLLRPTRRAVEATPHPTQPTAPHAAPLPVVQYPHLTRAGGVSIQNPTSMRCKAGVGFGVSGQNIPQVRGCR